MSLSKKEYYALLRHNFALFIHRTFQTVSPGELFLSNWHIEVIAYHLALCRQGKIKRLLITLPPRSLKSIIASVAFPAFVLGHDPTKQIICVSYSQNLANKLGRDTLIVMHSAWYRTCFTNARLHPKKQSETEFMTTKMGTRVATSVGGTLTGRGGNIIILDDPIKADEATSKTTRENCIEWYRNTLSSRLNNKSEDVMILIQQRLHQEDPAGYVLEHEDWVHVNLPATAERDEKILIGPNQYHIRKEGDLLHPEREDQQALDRLKQQLGSYNYSAQYQQRPAPQGGGMIQWKWMLPYEHAPKKEDGDLIVQSWDTACKAEDMHDWSACTTWLIKKNQYYLLHVYRKKLLYPALKRIIQTQAKFHHADQLLIEDKSAGTSLIQDLRQSSSLNITAIVPKDDKQTRMMMATPVIESGRVHVPNDAPWLADFHSELVLFPNSRDDDQIDCVSQFLLWVKDRNFPQNFEVYMVKSEIDPVDDYLLYPSKYYGPDY